MISRRDWLKGAAAAAVFGCSRKHDAPGAASPAPSAGKDAAVTPARPKRILVLGGTGFVGPPLVEIARARGHKITLFNRGKTNPGLFPDVETIVGDRITDLDRLKGRDWDAVVDTWAPGPTLVKRAAELLKDRVGHYLFVSTISVYKLTRNAIDESSPVLPLPPGIEIGKPIKIDETNYGPLKALAEEAATSTMPGRATIVRAGLIVGPGDPSDRFLYWPLRLARGGDVLAPGAPSDPVQFIDVRDLDGWMVTAIEQQHTGVFNAVGPSEPSLGPVLAQMGSALGSNARLEWVPHTWLRKNETVGWEHFPVAVPTDDDEAGFARVSAARAIAKGLRFRPSGETAKDALAWYRAQDEARRAKPRPGIAPDREAALLSRWRSRAS